jgi:TrwC relaxase
VRTEVASEFFANEHGRPPQDARELAAAIAKHSRPQTTAVAGYDLTFSPVKSVSTLWALAEPAVAAQIEKAHKAAISDALAFIEQHALFSRTGANGVRQVNVHGLVAARSPTATAGPATRICTPMSRWRTRCKPSTDAGSASTAGSCSKPPSPHPRPDM